MVMEKVLPIIIIFIVGFLMKKSGILKKELDKKKQIPIITFAGLLLGSFFHLFSV